MTMIRGMVSLAISSIFLVNLFIPIIQGANTTDWSAAETTIWGLATLGAVVGFVYGIFAVFGLV